MASSLPQQIRAAVPAPPAADAAGPPYFVGTKASIALSDIDMPRPDILLTSGPEGEGAVPRGSVPLLVEIASTTIVNDLDRKGVRYAAGGIPEYWIVDVRRRVIVRMWGPRADGYAYGDEVRLGDPLASATIEGLSVETAGL